MKSDRPQKFIILLANDSEDVCLLVEEALREVPQNVVLYSVENGEEVLKYLYRREKYAQPYTYPIPQLILMDLNMPKMNGKEAIAVIKNDPKFKTIPIVIFTTSHYESDLINSYNLGVNSFIVKPVTFEKLVETLKILCLYWFEIVSLPIDI